MMPKTTPPENKRLSRSEWLDIRAGQMSYADRIELGRILCGSDLSDAQKCRAAIERLHPDRVFEFTPEAVEYFGIICDGIAYWIEAESQLKYTPTRDEKAAGITEYLERVGPLGTVVALGKAFSAFPETALQQPYGEVFGILLADYEKDKLDRRIREIVRRRNEKNTK